MRNKREIKLVEVRGEILNSQSSEKTLSDLFEILSDWERQLQALPPEHRRLIISDVEEPTP